jgi:hypothetical protein
MQGALPVTSTQASVQPLNRPVNRRALPAAAANDHHFITRSVGPTSRLSLPVEQMKPLANGQRAVGNAPAPARSLAPATPLGIAGPRQNTTVRVETARPATGQAETHTGWRHFGSGEGEQRAAPAGQSAPPRQSTPAPQGNQGGWRHFGAQPAPANRAGGVAVFHGQGGGNRSFDC